MDVTILTLTSGWGGTEVQTLSLAEALVDHGHKVTLAHLGEDVYKKHIKEDRIVTQAIGAFTSPVSSRVCRDITSTLSKDICIYAKGQFQVGSITLERALRHRFRWFVTVEHGVGLPLPIRTSRRHCFGLLRGIGWWWYKNFLIPNMQRARIPDRLICVSDAVRNRIVHDYRGSAARTITVHNGINVEQFRPNDVYRRRARNSWGVGSDKFVFGSISRFDHVKGLDVAIRAFALLCSQCEGDSLRLVLIGDGPQFQELKTLATSSGYSDRIIFRAATKSPWIDVCGFDSFVMPSRTEGLPLALLEAMACQCVPIARAVGGIPEVVSKPAVGMLVEGDDIQAFSKGMRDLLAIPEQLRREIGVRARQRVVEQFNINKQLPRLLELCLNKHCA